MKVDIQHKEVPTGRKIKYPVLMRWVNGDKTPPTRDTLVVLFTGPSVGMALDKEGFGKSQKDWAPADGSSWQPFEGTLTFTP